MKYFFDSVLLPFATAQRYHRFCEVGASYGENADRLLEIPSARITLVDPCLDTDLAAKYAGRDNVEVRRGLSLEVLPAMSEVFDSVLIDGDHNWFTVFGELSAISDRGLLRKGGTIFLHDVGFPYGRRDMYYQPETIPAKFVHPNAMKGIINGRSALVNTGGVNAMRYNANHSNGPKNGVLTAVEDFMAQHPGEFWFTKVDDQFGLGILYRRTTLLQDTGFLLLWLKVSVRNLVSYVSPRRKKFAALAAVAFLLEIIIRLRSASRKSR